MFILPYEALLNLIGTTREKLASEKDIKIPVSLFKFMLKGLLETGDFDAEAYLAANPDVAEAVRTRKISSPKEHYVNYGYWEGRRGIPAVDEEWYLEKYTDVAAAVRARKLKSAEDHYYSAGAGELRIPNLGQEKDVRDWAILLGKPISK